MNSSEDLGVAIGVTFLLLIALGICFRSLFNSYDVISKIHLGAGIIHITSALAIAWIVYTESPVWEGRVMWALYAWVPIGNYERLAGLPVTSNATNCDDGCMQYFYHKEAGSVPVALLAVLFGVVSGGVHVLSVVFDDEAFVDKVKMGKNTWRWVDYAISSSLMITVVAIIVGVADVFVVVGVAASQFFLMIAAALLEEVMVSSSSGRISFYLTFLAYLVLVWMPIIASLHAPEHSSEAAIPEWVYVVMYGLFAVYTCFAIVMWVYLVHNEPPRDVLERQSYFVRMDLKYVALSLTSKLLLHWTLFNGILSRKNVLYHSLDEVQGDTSENNTLDAVIGAAVASLVFGAIFYVVSWYVTKDTHGFKGDQIQLLTG